MARPLLVKGKGCNEVFGQALCTQYLDPTVVEAQTEAVNEFVATHRIPDAMTNGDVIFLMGRGSIGV